MCGWLIFKPPVCHTHTLTLSHSHTHTHTHTHVAQCQLRGHTSCGSGNFFVYDLFLEIRLRAPWPHRSGEFFFGGGGGR